MASATVAAAARDTDLSSHLTATEKERERGEQGGFVKKGKVCRGGF